MNAQPLLIEPLSLPCSATLTLPGSKSHANRAIVVACLAQGETIIRNATPCDDVRVMVQGLQTMGYDVAWLDEAEGRLRVRGGIPQDASASGEVFCENAGTTLRFLCSVAALTPGRWTVSGNEHMRRRPIGDLVAALRALGADVSDTNGKPPVVITGGKLRGGSVSVDASKSSQFLSSLLLVGAALPKGLHVTVAGELTSPGYVELTERVLTDFGVGVRREGNSFAVESSALAARPDGYDIEGDWSAAGVWLVLEQISGSRITFSNLSEESSQSDRLLPQAIAALAKPGNATVDCTDFPDQVMNLALLGAFRSGTLQLIGARNLRYKECDRLAVITAQLSKAGIAIREHDDGVTVQGMGHKRPLPSAPVSLDPHDDHRMAMVFAALGLVRPNVTVEHPACVAKSYPNFFSHVAQVRSSPKPIAIVGMRASGKTNLAKRLAKVLGMRAVDTDKVIEEEVGPLPDYIAAFGWPEFRKREEEAVARCMQTGVVVSLGGGACESPITRQLLKERAVTVWLHATVEGTVERLQKVKHKRPKLTDLSLEEEVSQTLERRNPQYKEVAMAELSHRIPFPAQVPKTMSKLKRLVAFYDLHAKRFIPESEHFAKPPRRRKR